MTLEVGRVGDFTLTGALQKDEDCPQERSGPAIATGARVLLRGLPAKLEKKPRPLLFFAVANCRLLAKTKRSTLGLLYLTAPQHFGKYHTVHVCAAHGDADALPQPAVALLHRAGE